MGTVQNSGVKVSGVQLSLFQKKICAFAICLGQSKKWANWDSKGSVSDLRNKVFYLLHNALLFHIQCVFPRFTNSQRKDTKILVRFSYWEWSTFRYSSTGIKLTEIVSLLISDIFDYCGYIRFKGWDPLGWHFQIN